jgi:hypothetical protein
MEFHPREKKKVYGSTYREREGRRPVENTVRPAL